MKLLKVIWYLFWVGLSFEILLAVSVPLGLIALAIGATVGVVIGLVDVAVVLSGAVLGGADWDNVVLSPAGVAAEKLPGRVQTQHVRRDRAWPQYFAAQLRLDLASMIRLGVGAILVIGERAAGPLREKTGRKVFYLWSVLAIGAAAFAGLIVGTVAILVLLVAVAAVLAATVWGLGLATVAVLRGLDRAWQVVFRANGSCPRCYAVTTLPAYRCGGPHSPAERLDDDDLHRDIRPGRLGILWRRCSCGRRLPTTVLRASRKMQACCPTCTEPLHAGAAVATDARIPVFGAASSGKTHLIVSAVVSLLEPAPEDGPSTATLIDDYSRRRYDEYAALVHHDRSVPKTDAASQPIAVTVKLTEGRRVTLLHLFDAAGEALANPDINAAYSYIDNARTLLFVLDPFSISDIRDQLSTSYADAFREANPAQTDPEASYQATVTRLRLSGVRTDRQSLAFVLSKRDLLATLPLNGALPTDSTDVRAWLMTMGLDNLVLSAERDFAEVKFFAVSSKDRSKQGPLAPIRWLLGIDRFAVRVPRPIAARMPHPTEDAQPRRTPVTEMEQA